METNNENKNILSEPELRFREELKNCVKRIVDAADAKRANDIVAVHVGDKTIKLKIVPPKWGFRCAAGKAIPKAVGSCLTLPEFLCIFSIRKSASITMLNGCGWMQQPKLFVPKNKTRIK